MRYYLDTNILVYLITEDKDSLSHEVFEIIRDEVPHPNPLQLGRKLKNFPNVRAKILTNDRTKYLQTTEQNTYK